MGKLIFILISLWSFSLDSLVLSNFKFSLALTHDCPYYDYDKEIAKEISWHKDHLVKTLPSTISQSSFNEYLTAISDSVLNDRDFYKSYVGIRVKNESLYEITRFEVDVKGKIKGDQLTQLESLNNFNVVERYSDSLALNLKPNQSKKFCFLIHVPRSFIGLDSALEYSFIVSKVFILNNALEVSIGH